MSRVPFAQLKEESERLVTRIIEESLSDATYVEDRVESWCSSIPQNIIRNLHEFNKGFKFCATCVITRKNSSSLHINSTCLWNPSLDGFIVVKWENATMHCIINVFAIALYHKLLIKIVINSFKNYELELIIYSSQIFYGFAFTGNDKSGSFK